MDHQLEPLDEVHWLWKLKYEFAYEGESLQEHIGKLIDHTVQNYGTGSALETGASVSTVYNQEHSPHNWEVLEDLFLFLQPKLQEIWTHWGYSNKITKPVRSWVNVHKKTGKTMEHYHNQCPMVVSCYLKAPNKSGNFEYRDPLEYHRWGSPGEPQISLWREVEVETNDIIVFPGWLKHRTQVNQTDEDRVCLTINYDCD